jgi:exonuclease SbcC
MLNQLQYNVRIKKPSGQIIELKANHSFQDGLTAITGPNGKGKSFNLEMVAFLLHGTEALRGKMDDYEMLDGQLDFQLKGRVLRVNRTKSKATLKELLGDTVVDLASGSKPVNAKIIELFGYSSAVFNVANLCNQGKIEELGDMKPTARKQLVDETIGLNVLDELTVFIDEERKRINGGIKAVEGILIAPQEPVHPGTAHDSAAYKQSLDQLRGVRDKKNLIAAAAAKELVEPKLVEVEEDDGKLGEYQEDMMRRASIMTEYGVLDKQLKALPEKPLVLTKELDGEDSKLEEYQKTVRDHEALVNEFNFTQAAINKLDIKFPVMTQDEIHDHEYQNDLISKWNQKVALKKKNVPHDCPACKHHWEDEDPRLKTEFADVPDTLPEGGLSPVLLAAAKKNLENYEQGKPLADRLAVITLEMGKLNATEARLAVARILGTREAFYKSQAALSVEESRQSLTVRRDELLVNFTKTTDWSERIAAISAARDKVSISQMLHAAYLEKVEERDEARAALLAFPTDLDDTIILTEKDYVAALNYETNTVAYKKAKEAYDKAMEALEALRTELVDWDNGRAAVVDLRAKVKGYLLPSLNSVASGLINQMTGGELSWIVVNDQFEITVEGQRIETLSGAGKAVANLALRIGLGQVLTNRVFSVLMLDEIDASCDEDRAKYIASCLMNLTKSIKQIIQVSHKPGLVANHYVRL